MCTIKYMQKVVYGYMQMSGSSKDFYRSSKEQEVAVDKSVGRIFREEMGFDLDLYRTRRIQRSDGVFHATRWFFRVWAAQPRGPCWEGGSDRRGPWHSDLHFVGKGSSPKNCKYWELAVLMDYAGGRWTGLLQQPRSELLRKWIRRTWKESSGFKL